MMRLPLRTIDINGEHVLALRRADTPQDFILTMAALPDGPGRWQFYEQWTRERAESLVRAEPDEQRMEANARRLAEELNREWDRMLPFLHIDVVAHA